MSSNIPETAAPEGFWEEVREHHDAIWAKTKGRRHLGGLTFRGLEVWARREDAKDNEVPLATATRWHSQHRIGGTVLATMSVATMRLKDVRALEGADVAQSDAPVETAFITYTLPPVWSKQQPLLAVRTALYTPQQAAQAPPHTPEGALVDIERAKLGLITPSAGDYERAARELAIGASGTHRVSPDQLQAGQS